MPILIVWLAFAVSVIALRTLMTLTRTVARRAFRKLMITTDQEFLRKHAKAKPVELDADW